MIWFAWIVAIGNQLLTLGAERPELWWYGIDAIIWIWAILLTYIGWSEGK